MRKRLSIDSDIKSRDRLGDGVHGNQRDRDAEIVDW
jgi:hypothetical protein